MTIQERLTRAVQNDGIYRVRYFNDHTHENIEVEVSELGEIVRMIEENVIKDAKTIIGIRYLKEE